MVSEEQAHSLIYRMQSSEIDTGKHALLVFDSSTKSILQTKYSLLNKWCWNNWTSIGKVIYQPNLILSIWTMELNVKCKN